MAGILAITAIAVSLTVAGAGADPPSATPPPAASTFTSTSVTGVPIPGDGPLRVAFPEPGRIAMNAGCNQHIGTAEFEQDTLVIGPLASTMMACAPPRDEADTWLSHFAQGPLTWHRHDRTLTLSSPDTRVVLTQDPTTPN